MSQYFRPGKIKISEAELQKLGNGRAYLKLDARAGSCNYCGGSSFTSRACPGCGAPREVA